MLNKTKQMNILNKKGIVPEQPYLTNNFANAFVIPILSFKIWP